MKSLHGLLGGVYGIKVAEDPFSFYLFYLLCFLYEFIEKEKEMVLQVVEVPQTNWYYR